MGSPAGQMRAPCVVYSRQGRGKLDWLCPAQQRWSQRQPQRGNELRVSRQSLLYAGSEIPGGYTTLTSFHSELIATMVLRV